MKTRGRMGGATRGAGHVISYAQNFEDVMAARLFAPEYRGFYVDIGAADPVFLSVTKHFYDSGWNGINVEPLAQAHQKLVEARPRDINLNLIVGRESGKGSFFEISNYPENSTTDQAVMELLRKQGHKVCTHDIEKLSLSDLCDRYVGSRPIDFMKIDVEGGELCVIEGADWTKYRPILLIIEAVVINGREENWSAWEPAVLKAGYMKVYFDGLNNFYLREESSDLKDRFRLPPNLFDGFEVLRPDQHAAILGENQAYHAAIIENLTSQLEATERQVGQQQAELEAALAATETRRAALAQEAELAEDLRQQLEQARAESAWLRAERTADAALLREQVARYSAVTEDLASQHGLLLAKSEEHAGELRRHLEREVELATRIATAEAERERASQQFATAEALVSKLQSKLAEIEKLLSQARAEAEKARAAELCSRNQQSKLSDQLATSVARHRTDVSEARELQRWFEQTLVESNAAASSAETALRVSHAELTELRHEVAEYAQAKRDNEIKLEASCALSESQAHAIVVLEAWLNEGRALLHTLRAEREPWGIRLARHFAGSRERERQTELGERVAHWSAVATDILAERVFPTMDVNMIDEKPVTDMVRRADSLDELLFLADRAFVRCAFLTLLGRDIDPDGEAYYLSRLRRGYAKISLLKQLRYSEEGRRNDPGIAGLDRAIARYRRANMPLVGWVVRQLNGEEGDGAAVRRLRAIENRIGALQNQLSKLPRPARHAE